jgi:hypothetical protein
VHGAVFANQGTILMALWSDRGTNLVGTSIKSGCRMTFEYELRRDRGTILIGAGSLVRMQKSGLKAHGAGSRVTE